MTIHKDEILYETIYTPEFARKHINKRISNGNFPSIVRKKLFGILDALLTECDGKYCLASPCIHHLTDSPADRKRYDLYKKAEKEKASSQETTRQVKF